MKSRKKIVVAGGGKIESAERAAMDGNDVVEPHGQVRKIFRECVDVRVAIVSAIGAVGRKALRRESVFKKIGIGVGADPALVGDLEISLCDVGEQRGELERPKFQFDAGAPPLLLKSRADESGLFLGRAFQS